eukprot:1705547-Amphidinium_carterae.1
MRLGLTAGSKVYSEKGLSSGPLLPRNAKIALRSAFRRRRSASPSIGPRRAISSLTAGIRV